MVKVGCIVLWFLSFTDFWLTWYAVSRGYAYEGSPLASWLIEQSYALAFAVKQLLITLSCVGIWLLSDRRSMRIPLYFGLILFGTLVVYEVIGIWRMS